ncbi:MAG: saccharopine dehydrogenase C-terminal domain-containing protein [Bacteroidales bacterium]
MKKTILVLGAGLSAPSLIRYLLEYAGRNGLVVRVGDIDVEQAAKRIAGDPSGIPFRFDVMDENQRNQEVEQAEIVVSLLPPKLHFLVAQTCLKHSKNLVTASYVSPELRALDAEVRKAGILMLNEIGLDPGIDHMSAKQIIDRIKSEGGEMISFKSSTGGLVAPKYDNNPWNYKFTWNPKNVVIAGKGGAQFIKRGRYKYIPQHKIFTRVQRCHIEGYGEFEIYPNRDSLKYRSAYGIDGIPTMFRGTIRRPGFCRTWNLLVQLGLTDDTFVIEDAGQLTYRDFTNSFLKYDKVKRVEEKLADYLGIDPECHDMYKLRWLGLFENEPIGLVKGTPAEILQKKLEEKWALDPEDRDLIVMLHDFEYRKGEKYYRILSSLAVEGTETETAMARTVGLPAAIATRLILEKKINLSGVRIPIDESVYQPVLEELKQYGIAFKDEEHEIAEPNGD